MGDALVHALTDGGALLEEMHAHLAEIHRAARGNRQRELEALYLLAVEREALAAVGYGGAELHARIAQLECEPDMRAVVARALRWAAREERTHAVLARGLLVHTGGFAMRVRSYAADLGGLIGGWSAAVLQHTRTRAAPLSRLAARVLTVLGRLSGKVPRAAANELRAQSFAGFCRFQIHAEHTAVVSWERIARVLADDTRDARYVPIASRIADDERHHAAMLNALLSSFDDSDRAREGRNAAQLESKLGSIAPSFVRPTNDLSSESALGRGGEVYVREDPRAARGDDPAASTRLLESALIDTGLLARVLERAGPAPRVAVKTSFMMSYDRRDPSPHVDPHLADALARMLRAHGAREVTLLEAPNHYDRFFSGRSVESVARYAGFTSDAYRVVDAQADQVPHAFRRGVGQQSIARAWRDADVRIVFGKMRTHPSWLVHLTLNTLESLGRRVDELIFHDREADLSSGLMMLLDAFPPHLALLDATHHVPDGLTGILGDPTPAHPGRLYASRDPLALDLVAARHMGLERFPHASALAHALDWFDDPRVNTRVDGQDTPIANFSSPHRNDLTVLLSALAYPVYLLGGERGSLWVPTMDPEAFPPSGNASLFARMVRPVLRALFGFGRPPKRVAALESPPRELSP